MTVNEIVQAILRGDYDANLDHIVGAINTRRKTRRAEVTLSNLVALQPGTRVRTKGLSPKYLNGLTGEVVPSTGRRRDNDITVKLDHPFLAQRYAIGGNVNVPAGCLEAI